MQTDSKIFSQEFIELCREHRHLFAGRTAEPGDWCYSTLLEFPYQLEQRGTVDYGSDVVFYMPDFDFLLEQIKLELFRIRGYLDDCDVVIGHPPKGNWSVKIILPEEKGEVFSEGWTLGVALFKMWIILSARRTKYVLESYLANPRIKN
jgi:hypothetical protein